VIADEDGDPRAVCARFAKPHRNGRFD
jgi:hypothetical protein